MVKSDYFQNGYQSGCKVMEKRYVNTFHGSEQPFNTSKINCNTASCWKQSFFSQIPVCMEKSVLSCISCTVGYESLIFLLACAAIVKFACFMKYFLLFGFVDFVILSPFDWNNFASKLKVHSPSIAIKIASNVYLMCAMSELLIELIFRKQQT